MSRTAPRAGTRRGRPRFAPMMRTRSNALIASGAGLLIAAILGTQLGQSAISQIDPVHFQGPEARPVGIDPVAAGPAADDPFSRPYVWSQERGPGAAGCIGDCEARQARAAAAAFAEPMATRDPAAPYWRDVTPTTELRPWPPGELPNREPGVERYMHYPVTQEQAAERTRGAEALALEPAAPAPPPAPGEEPADEQ